MQQSYDDGVLLGLVGEVMGLIDLAELRHGIVTAFLELMPLRWASLNDVGPDGVVAIVQPHLDDVWTGRFAELADENPLLQHWRRTHDGRAYRFSDVCTREELEATRLYQEVYL